MALFGLLKPKCNLCRVPFGDYDVPKDVKTADGSWKKVCKLCYTTMGGAPRTNILGDANHNPRQARLW